MGVTLLQTDESVREGYWIYSPPGNAGCSLNDAESTLLPGLNKSVTSVYFVFPGSNSTTQVCVIAALSTSAKNLLAFLVLQKQTFGKSCGDESLSGSLFFFFFFNDIMVQKDPAPTHDATILLCLAKGCFSLSFVSDIIISQMSACIHKPNLTGQVKLQAEMTQPKIRLCAATNCNTQ